MQHETRSPRRLAGLLACILVLLGTTGAAVLDAAVHADGVHAGHHDNGGAPDTQGSDCVFCVASSLASSSTPAPVHMVAPAPGAHRAPYAHETVVEYDEPSYLTPPVRGPPSA
jgi:hypothetical protein